MDPLLEADPESNEDPQNEPLRELGNLIEAAKKANDDKLEKLLNKYRSELKVLGADDEQIEEFIKSLPKAREGDIQNRNLNKQLLESELIELGMPPNKAKSFLNNVLGLIPIHQGEGAGVRQRGIGSKKHALQDIKDHVEDRAYKHFEYLEIFDEISADENENLERSEVVGKVLKLNNEINTRLENELKLYYAQLDSINADSSRMSEAVRLVKFETEVLFKELRNAIEDSFATLDSPTSVNGIKTHIQPLIAQLSYSLSKEAPKTISFVSPQNYGTGCDPMFHVISGLENRLRDRIYDIEQAMLSDWRPGLTFISTTCSARLGNISPATLKAVDSFLNVDENQIHGRIKSKLDERCNLLKHEAKINLKNPFSFLIQRTRYSFMFLLSMITILTLLLPIESSSPRALLRDLKVTQADNILYWVSICVVVAISVVAITVEYFRDRSEDIEEKLHRLKGELERDVLEALSHWIKSAKTELLRSLAEQQSMIDYGFATLSALKSADGALGQGNSQVQQLKHTIEVVLKELDQLSQERKWAKIAMKRYWDSKMVSTSRASSLGIMQKLLQGSESL